MKKKVVLLSLLSASLISVSLVSVFASKSGSSFNSLVRASQPTGRHYPAIAATSSSAGLKEYWTDCNGTTTDKKPINSDDYLDMSVEQSQAVLQDLLLNSPEDFRIIQAHEHVDNDSDYYCDVEGCNYGFESVDSVSIITPVTYMGRGEVLKLSSSIVAHGGASSKVVFSIPSSTIFSLVDNEDGTAFLSTSSASATETSEKSIVVTVQSDFDPDKTATVKIFASTYGSLKRTSITTFFGTNNFQFIPYFIGTNFIENGDNLEQESANKNGHVTLEKVLGAFKNQGTWTVVSEEADSAVLTITDPKDAYGYFKAVMTRNGTGTNVTYSKHKVEYSSFPVDLINSVVSKSTASSIISPDDGTVFTFGKDSSSATVNSNGDADAYISKLSTNNYYVIDSGSSKVCVSPERTLKVTISKTDSGFKAVFGTQKAPTKTAWSASDSSKMIALIGEEIPFVANDYGSWSKDENYMYASSTKLEAELVAIETLDKAAGYIKSVETDGVYYSKDINNYASYTIVVDGTDLYIYLNAKEVSSWLGTELAAALDVSEGDIPAATGTSFMFLFGDSKASVQVKGGDLDAYKLALESAGYMIVEKRSAQGVLISTSAVSSDKTIVINFNEITDGYTLDFSKQSPITDVDYTDSDKQIMNDFMGCVIPFVPGFAGKWYSSVEQIYATSTRVEAQVVAKSVFDADDSFVFDAAKSTAANLLYTKQVSKYLSILVNVASSKITITKENPKLSTWEAEDIAAALGSKTKEILPEFVESGATFNYEFGQDSATVFVFTDSSSVSMVNYKDALGLAGFTSSDGTTYKTSADTLTIEVSKVANKQFKIVATAHLPEGYFDAWPIETINGKLKKDAGVQNIPTPEGSMFFFEENGECDVTITVTEGGSISSYVTALGDNGFVLNDDSYTNGNVIIKLSAGDDGVYSIRISLAVIPAAAEWPEDALRVIQAMCAYEEFTISELPCPAPYSKITVNEDSWVSYSSIVVEGVDVEAYIQAIKDAGFNTGTTWNGYKAYEDNSYWYISIAVSGTTITITAY